MVDWLKDGIPLYAVVWQNLTKLHVSSNITPIFRVLKPVAQHISTFESLKKR
jgi:hypothetical protein